MTTLIQCLLTYHITLFYPSYLHCRISFSWIFKIYEYFDRSISQQLQFPVKCLQTYWLYFKIFIKYFLFDSQQWLLIFFHTNQHNLFEQLKLNQHFYFCRCRSIYIPTLTQYNITWANFCPYGMHLYLLLENYIIIIQQQLLLLYLLLTVFVQFFSALL